MAIVIQIESNDGKRFLAFDDFLSFSLVADSEIYSGDILDMELSFCDDNLYEVAMDFLKSLVDKIFDFQV